MNNFRDPPPDFDAAHNRKMCWHLLAYAVGCTLTGALIGAAVMWWRS